MTIKNFALLGLLWAPTLTAQVSRVDVESRQLAMAGYEELSGTIHFALDPDNSYNARIVDLDLAPRNAQGRVEASANFIALQAADPDQRRGVALVEVSNRGGRASLNTFNRGGDLLMREGITVIWVGWQFDVPARGRGEPMKLTVPTVRGEGGEPITGLVRSDWTQDRAADVLGLGHRNHAPYQVFDPESPDNSLTERDGRDAPRRTVPRSEWQFTDDGQGITREGGFEAGKLYELVYRAVDPSVVGLGLAAIRDTISFAKYDEDAPFPVDKGIAVGISQTGRFLRHYLYQGFNTDTEGRQALDGILSLTAGAGRGSFNHRFGQPSRDAHRYSAFFYPTDIFPFTSAVQRDPVTGWEDGLFAHQHDDAHLPKVFYINSGYEYWGRAAGLIHASVDGKTDVDPSANERIYHLAGAQHFPGGLGRGNPIDSGSSYRALAKAMFDWVADDLRPPDSRFPSIDEGEMVLREELHDPEIPGVVWPREPHTAYRADYGEQWEDGIVTIQPPELGRTFPMLVPQVDAHGNELSGVRSPELDVPLGTYFPWALREGRAGGNGEMVDFTGGFLPFPRTEAEKRAAGDPRPSIESLYESEEVYLTKLRAAAEDLARARLLLEEDVEHTMARGEQLWEFCQRDPAQRARGRRGR